MRLIDAEKLQRVFSEVSTSIMREPKMTKDMEHIVRACIMTTEIINDAPTIEAEPVKHGRWESCCNLMGEYFKCSECGYKAEVPTCMGEPIFIYCPNCGAKMDGGADDV